MFSVGVGGRCGATRATGWKRAKESGTKGRIPLRYLREVLWDLIICGVRPL